MVSQRLSAIPVFYAANLLADAESFSKSAGKPRLVVEEWRHAGLEIDVRPVPPASEADLCLAHDPEYVRGVLARSIDNGFGNRSPSVAHSLPYTSGAMVAAARKALETGCASAPVSGFHHAHYDAGAGFCTFNGLIVAARKLIAEHAVERVLILDCDMHYGDGTEAIIERLGLAETIENLTFGRWFDEPVQVPEYLAQLRESAERFKSFDLILYQAGADVHVDDPLGGVLTTAEMIQRDRIVFEAARSASVPVAWNLAGGYQQPLKKVVALHVNTMRECARVYANVSRPSYSAIGRHE